MTMIVLTNSSTVVADAEVITMARACAHQVRYHAGPVWAKHAPPVVFMPKNALPSVPPGSWVFNVLDDSDQANALGWHTEDQGGLVYGRIFAKPVLDNGGDVLTKPLSVASVASHEVLETLVDPNVNLWADDGKGTLYALEVGDPVESDAYPIGVGRTPVTVSNFVTPAWFDAQAPLGARYDWMGKLTKPFQLSAGGYVVRMTAGTVSQTFGQNYPDWRRATKDADTSRAARRK